MFKKWDKVLFSSCPAAKVPYEEYVVKSDQFVSSSWEDVVFLENFSWYVSAKKPFMKKLVELSCEVCSKEYHWEEKKYCCAWESNQCWCGWRPIDAQVCSEKCFESIS